MAKLLTQQVSWKRLLDTHQVATKSPNDEFSKATYKVFQNFVVPWKIDIYVSTQTTSFQLSYLVNFSF